MKWCFGCYSRLDISKERLLIKKEEGANKQVDTVLLVDGDDGDTAVGACDILPARPTHWSEDSGLN